MNATAYQTIIESIGNFRIHIDREMSAENPFLIRWRAKADCGLCFGGRVSHEMSDDELRRIVLEEVMSAAVKSSGFINECVRVSKERE
jgi:hypothetical protein